MKEFVSTGGVYKDGYPGKPLPYRKITNNEDFERDGYLFLPKLIANPEDLKVPFPLDQDGNRASGQFTFHKTRIERYDYQPMEQQVNGSLARYNIPIYRELHFQIKNHLEKLFGIDLFPTYFYDRFYSPGQLLHRHSDRPACEISVTLQISTNSDKPWPIWFNKPDGTDAYVVMNDGDAAVYRGCEREHWRDPLESKYNAIVKKARSLRGLEDDTYHHQIFLHYVDANGPFVQYAGDNSKWNPAEM